MRTLTIVTLVAWTALGLCGQEVAPPKGKVPAGTILQIRLLQTLSSMTSRPDQPVSAMLIRPVMDHGQVVLPAKSELQGSLRQVRRVGLGFSHETAMIQVEFDHLVLPDGAAVPLRGQVSMVNDSRETVDAQGRIHGIRATASFSSAITGLGISLASIDPVMLAFSLSSSLSVFRIPDSEILLPAGSELAFALAEPIPAFGPFPPLAQPRLQSVKERAEWTARLQALPFRTATGGKGIPSDIVSIAYVGSASVLARAFDAAGWTRVDPKDGKSSIHAMRSVVENQGYRAAPMSLLLLDGKAPAFEYAKTLNTFFKRHHLRIYDAGGTDPSAELWVSTATHDSGIAFSRASKTFIHLIDGDVDVERGKVVDDLLLTGCVDNIDYIERPWVPGVLTNATGDEMKTDSRIALVFLNRCDRPQRAGAETVPPARVRVAPELRPVRDLLLRLKSDAYRGNVGYQSVSGFRMLHRTLRKSRGHGKGEVMDIGGEEFHLVRGVHHRQEEGIPRDPGVVLAGRKNTFSSLVDISMSAGASRFANEAITAQSFHLPSGNPGEPGTELSVPASLQPGWALSPKITLNFAKRFSNEFSFTSNQTQLRIDGIASLGEQPQTMSARIRQFSYNLLLHFRPNGSRFRPYVAAGPAFQLIRAVDARPTSNRLLRFTLADLNFIAAAYNFGSKPPLDGGGIFQLGVQYGAGFKYQATPRLFWRVDFRETLSPQPDFWSDSARNLAGDAPFPIRAGDQRHHGPLRHNLFTIGIGASF